MSSPLITFNKEQFNRLFPHYILIDHTLTIFQVGDALNNQYPSIKGSAFNATFSTIGTNTQIETFKDLLSYNTTEIIISSLDTPSPFTLKACVEYLEENNVVLLAGQLIVEKEKSETEKFYLQILNAIPCDIAVFNKKHQYLFVNPYAIKNPEVREWIVGKTDEDFCRFRNKPMSIALERRKLYNSVVDSKKEQEIVEQVTTPEGNIKHHLRKIYPVLDTSGEVSFVIGYGLDITERVKVAEELTIAIGKAEEAGKAKQVFLANMSHEIRTPMTGILGIADLLMKTTLTTQQQEFVSLIIESTHTLVHIINDVLDIVKIESGKFEFEETPFNLADKVKNIYKTFVFKADEKDILLEYNNQVPISCYTVGDPHRLGQVLNNLVNNAIKFTNKGKVTINTKLIDKNNGMASLYCEVIDTGIGISKENYTKVFNPFEQATSETTRKYGGSGLGLAICKQLIEKQGGSISLESELGKGTTFTFTIPYKLWEEKAVVQSGYTGQKIKYETPPLNILVAEDMPINQIIVQNILEGFGHSVDLVGDGKQAVQKVKANHYDLILMDINMPEMDGIEATMKIRQLPDHNKASIPIIALTANAFKSDIDTYIAAGVNNCVTKPYTQEKLLNSIQNLFQDKKPILKDPWEEIFNKEKLYDLNKLGGIGNDPIIISKMVKAFLTQIKGDMMTLPTEISNMNWNQVYRICHKIKQSVQIFDAHHCIPLVEQMEINARFNKDLAMMPGIFIKLEQNIEALNRQLENDYPPIS